MKLILMGTPDFGLASFEALRAQGQDIICVYSQPPRPAGRGQRERKSPIHEWAESHGIEVRTPISLKTHDEQAAFIALGADAAIVIAYGLILPKTILEAPKLGCINLHASLLPRWRGAAPIERAILAGDQKTGVCVMKMDQGLDTGPVFAREEITIDPSKGAVELRRQLAQLGAAILPKSLTLYAKGSLVPQPQEEAGATYAQKIDKGELKIQWDQDAETILRQIRAFDGWGAWTRLGDERIKILAAESIPNHNNQTATPGTILSPGFTIACGQGALRVGLIQRPGKKAMPIDIALMGWTIPVGVTLE